jgi:superfamily II DNA or RNA helicase
MSSISVAARPVLLTRDGGVLRLTFGYEPALVARVRVLPHARFDPETRSWTTPVCAQSLEQLRAWYGDGLLDVSPDDLVDATFVPTKVAPATVTRGSQRRPYLVRMAGRDDQLFTRLRAIPGNRWERDAGGFSYPPQAWAALVEFVRRGIIGDPHQLLLPHAVTVGFDGGTGSLVVTGDDRATAAFAEHFPYCDVLAIWAERGVDVGFADAFCKEIYDGELARWGEGIQPDGLLVPLYPYQAVDVAVAVSRSSLLIASEPGTGKTAVAIGAAHELLTNRGEVPRVVVVVPGAVRSHWRREIMRFTGASEDDIVVIDGERKKRHAAYDRARDAKWLILHYDVLHLDKDRIGPLCDDAVVIADECHRIKSPDAARTKVMRALAQRAARRWGLSGTPVETAPGEFFSLLSGFIAPGLLGSPAEFLGRYCYPGRFGGYEGARNLGELRDRTRTHVVRRRKADVAAHLPPLRVKTIVLDPDTAYANALKRAHRSARDEIAAQRRSAAGLDDQVLVSREDVDEIEAGADMTAVGLLRLLCASPRLIAASDAPSAKALCDAGLVPDADGPKIDWLRTAAGEAQAAGDRLLVYTSSLRMADLVRERLTTDGIRVVRYTGNTPDREREATVTAFTTPSTAAEPGPTVMVSTDAGAEGLNLGRCCTTLINLDMPWTAARAWQRANRIHRVDGDVTKNYLVINLTLRGTLEEGIIRLLEQRADLSDAILGEDGGRRSVSGRGGRNLYAEALAELNQAA